MKCLHKKHYVGYGTAVTLEADGTGSIETVLMGGDWKSVQRWGFNTDKNKVYIEYIIAGGEVKTAWYKIDGCDLKST